MNIVGKETELMVCFETKRMVFYAISYLISLVNKTVQNNWKLLLDYVIHAINIMVHLGFTL